MEPRDFWPLDMTVCIRCGLPVPTAQAVLVTGPNGDGAVHVECPEAAA